MRRVSNIKMEKQNICAMCWEEIEEDKLAYYHGYPLHSKCACIIKSSYASMNSSQMYLLAQFLSYWAKCKELRELKNSKRIERRKQKIIQNAGL